MTGTWASGFATGDVTQAVEWKRGIGAISDTTLGGSAASIDVTGIVASYAHLLIFAYARGDTALTFTPLKLRFNGDAAANYDYQQLLGNGAGVSSNEAFAQTAAFVGAVPAANAGANLFGACVFCVPHYAGSSNNKLALSLNSFKTGTSASNMDCFLSGGFWRSNAAITQVTLLPAAGSFVAGTRVTIYACGA